MPKGDVLELWKDKLISMLYHYFIGTLSIKKVIILTLKPNRNPKPLMECPRVIANPAVPCVPRCYYKRVIATPAVYPRL